MTFTMFKFVLQQQFVVANANRIKTGFTYVTGPEKTGLKMMLKFTCR